MVNRSPELTYFSEDTDKLGRVLNIFIRLNSGGVPLSYSDLLLSIAIAQWKNADAREEINSLKAALFERYEFNLPKDFILKACLMLADIGSIKFDVENFNKDNSATLEREWPTCKRYLTLAVSLLRTFGYNSQNLTATNAILPVAYYLKVIGADDNYVLSTKFMNDRRRLLLWFNRSILKQGTWGAGVDTFISQLRETLRKEVPLKTSPNRFPYEEIEKTMLRSGRSLQFRADEIDELLDLPKGKGRTFTLLSILFPSSGLHVRDDHVDHIYPHALFGRKINNAEHQLAFIEILRLITDHLISPEEAVRAYHGILQAKGIRPRRSLQEDLLITEPSLIQADPRKKTISISSSTSVPVHAVYADRPILASSPVPATPASEAAIQKSDLTTESVKPDTHPGLCSPLWPVKPDLSPDFSRMTSDQRLSYNLWRLNKKFR